MRLVVLGIFMWIVLLSAIALTGCSAMTVHKYSCEGKCSGELSRDIDATSPEQLKALKEPK